MNFFPLQQASRNVIEIYMLIHRADKAENRCFSYFCFALQMDSKRHKSPSCHSNALPGSLFCAEPPDLRDSPEVHSQASSSLREEQKSETPGIFQARTRDDGLRHDFYFLRSHQGGTAFFLPSLKEGGKQAARPGSGPAPTPPRPSSDKRHAALPHDVIWCVPDLQPCATNLHKSAQSP